MFINGLSIPVRSETAATPARPVRRQGWPGGDPSPPRGHCQGNGGRRQSTDGIAVSTPPLSTRDHQPCRLVVPSVHAKLSRRGGPSRGAWRHRILRGHSILVPQVWTSLCSYSAATTRSARRHLARGRSVSYGGISRQNRLLVSVPLYPSGPKLAVYPQVSNNIGLIATMGPSGR